MTDTGIHYSALEDKFWIRDGDDMLWFDSPLEAKHALRKVETKQAVDAEVALIVEWLRDRGCVWATDVETAEDIENRKYKEKSNA